MLIITLELSNTIRIYNIYWFTNITWSNYATQQLIKPNQTEMGYNTSENHMFKVKYL